MEDAFFIEIAVLVERIREGDKRAEKRLQDKLQRLVCGWLIKFGCQEDTESLAEVILAAVIRSIHDGQLKNPRALIRFISITSYRYHLNLIRGNDLLKKAKCLDDVKEFPSQNPEEQPEEAYLRKERAERINNALKLLPPEQCLVIRLRMLGFSDDESAVYLSAPLGTVKSRIRYGLAKLRKLLADDCPQKRNHLTTQENSELPGDEKELPSAEASRTKTFTWKPIVG